MRQIFAFCSASQIKFLDCPVTRVPSVMLWCIWLMCVLKWSLFFCFIFVPVIISFLFVDTFFYASLQGPQWIVFPLWPSRCWICTCSTGWWQRRAALWRLSTRNCGGRSPRDSTCLPQSPVQPSPSAHSQCTHTHTHTLVITSPVHFFCLHGCWKMNQSVFVCTHTVNYKLYC